MIPLMLKKEFLENIAGLRFLVTLFLSFFLIVMGVYVLTEGYRHQGEEYRMKAQAREDALDQYAHRNRLGAISGEIPIPPSFLRSLFQAIPFSSYYDSLDTDPMTVLFPTFNLLFIIGFVMSLCAILFGYDAICAEKEEGTLKLTLSCGAPRYKIILAKWIAGILSILVPFSVSLLSGLIIMSSTSYVSLGGGGWAALSVILVVSFIYMSAFYLLGLLMSSFFRRSSTSVIGSLVAWATFTLILPNISPYVASLAYPTPSKAAMERKLQALDEEREDALREAARPYWGKGHTEAEVWELSGGGKINAAFGERRKKISASFRKKESHQAAIAKFISCLSPLPCYVYAATDLSTGGVRGIQHFRQQVGVYYGQFWNYVQKQWSDALAQDPDMSIEDRLDLSDRPRFRYTPENISSRINGTLVHILLLVGFNVLFFMISYMAFLRYDPR